MSNSKPTIITLKILNFAIMMSVFILVGILFFFSTQDQSWTTSFRIKDGNLPIVLALTIVGLSTAGLSFAFPLIMKPKNQNQTQSYQEISQGPKSPFFLDFDQLTQDTFSLTIIRMALGESVGIFGFVLGFLNQSVLLAIPYVFVSVVLILLVGPLFRLVKN